MSVCVCWCLILSVCVYECVCVLVLDYECVCVCVCVCWCLIMSECVVVSVIGVTFTLSYIYASCRVCLSPGGVVNKQKYAIILLKIIKAIIFISGYGFSHTSI